jgi:hypothetical protein
MPFSNVYQKRLQDLVDNIAQDTKLLKAFEDKLRSEDNPRRVDGYICEIERQKESVNRYQREFDELQEKMRGSQPDHVQVQTVSKLLQDMDNKLNYESLLTRYNISEKNTIAVIAKQLSNSDLILIQKLLDGVDNNQISNNQIQQMLQVLEGYISSFSPNQSIIAKVIKTPNLDLKNKLKITLPIIPLLMQYEGEIELGSGFNIQSAWEKLISKLRKNKQ